MRIDRGGQRGFSLIEMMIGVTIFGIVCVGAYKMLTGTQDMSALMRAKNDAERQSLLLLHRISRFYMEKKPGGIIPASQATDTALFADPSCIKAPDAVCQLAKATTPQYSFSLHHDTEGCRQAVFPNFFRDCKALSVASGMWTARWCGCSQINAGRVYTAVTKCQRINSAASPGIRSLQFTPPLTQCIQCAPGERPVVVENDYHTDWTRGTRNFWKVYPDGARNLAAFRRQGSSSVNQRANQIENSLLSRTAGMEFCTSLQNGTVMLDVNAYYIVKSDDPATGATLTLKRVSQKTSYPVNILTGNGLRFVPDPNKP